MTRRKKLVIGASGFVGSHVTRQLVENGEDIRVMLRRTSSTKGIDDLDVERCYGDIFDDAALREAMTDCDVVFYCVVDARILTARSRAAAYQRRGASPRARCRRRG